jgi:tripartite ATP-independent transporter DctP family solute receptor
MKPKKSFQITLGFLTIALTGLTVLAFYARSRQSNVIVLKLAHSLDETHPVHQAMVFMQKRMKERSNGRIRVEIFPNEQLGSEREMIEQVLLGCIDMTKTSTSPLESFIPEMGVFSVPYIFRDKTHYWNVLKGPIGEKLKQSGVKKGLYGLCYYDSGSRSFYTKDKPILTPNDLQGMKIRVMESKTAMAMVEALGGKPTPIAWGELYTALQQGVVDGAENNPPSLDTSRHYEVCKYYSLDEHTMVPDIILISNLTWEHLSQEDRELIQDVANESMEEQIRLWGIKTEESMRHVQEEGVEVFHPDKKPFVNKVKDMHDSYKGTEIGYLIQQIKDTE